MALSWVAKFLIALLYHFCGEKLRGGASRGVRGCGCGRLGGAVAGGADDGPGFDIGEAVGGVDEAVILGEGAGGLVLKIGEVDLVEADGGDIVDPLAEEGFVFSDAEGLVEGAAGAENEVVHEGVAVIGEVEAGGGGLGGVVVGKEVGVGAELDFVEEDVVVAGTDDVEEEILARFVERDLDFETEGFEFALEDAGEFGEIIGVDGDEAESLVGEAGGGEGGAGSFGIVGGEGRVVFEFDFGAEDGIIEGRFPAEDGADGIEADALPDGLAN